MVSSFPPVPSGGGARRLAFVWILIAVLAAVMVGGAFFASAAPAERLGLGTTVREVGSWGLGGHHRWRRNA